MQELKLHRAAVTLHLFVNYSLVKTVFTVRKQKPKHGQEIGGAKTDTNRKFVTGALSFLKTVLMHAYVLFLSVLFVQKWKLKRLSQRKINLHEKLSDLLQKNFWKEGSDWSLTCVCFVLVLSSEIFSLKECWALSAGCRSSPLLLSLLKLLEFH